MRLKQRWRRWLFPQPAGHVGNDLTRAWFRYQNGEITADEYVNEIRLETARVMRERPLPARDKVHIHVPSAEGQLGYPPDLLACITPEMRKLADRLGARWQDGGAEEWGDAASLVEQAVEIVERLESQS